MEIKKKKPNEMVNRDITEGKGNYTENEIDFRFD